MDTNSGTNSGSSGGMTQAQADNLSRIGIPADVIDEIRRANLPDPVLQTLGTVSSPQQLANEVGTLWLQRDLVERIRGVPAATQPMGQARVETPLADGVPDQGAIYTPPASSSPQGNQQPQYTAPPTPPQGYQQPQQGAYPPQQQYGQMPEQGQQGQQGAYPQQYPPQQYPPQQQGQYPPQQYQQYPQQGAPAYGQPPYAAPQAAPEKKGSNTLLWVLGGVLLVIVLCVVAVFATLAALGNAVVGVGNTVGGLATAVGFTTSMSTGDYDQARDMLSGDLANRYTEATLQSRWEALVGKGNTLSVNSDLGNPRQDGDRVVVPWTIEGANGKTYNVDLYITSLSSSNQSAMQIVDAKPDLIPSP